MSTPRQADAQDAAASRRRHPCMRTPVRSTELHGRVADDLELRGAFHPEVAAAVLAVRGATGLDQDGFARRAGVSPELLDEVERGALGRDQLPGALRRMVPRGDDAGRA